MLHPTISIMQLNYFKSLPFRTQAKHLDNPDDITGDGKLLQSYRRYYTIFFTGRLVLLILNDVVFMCKISGVPL